MYRAGSTTEVGNPPEQLERHAATSSKEALLHVLSNDNSPHIHTSTFDHSFLMVLHQLFRRPLLRIVGRSNGGDGVISIGSYPRLSHSHMGDAALRTGGHGSALRCRLVEPANLWERHDFVDIRCWTTR